MRRVALSALITLLVLSASAQAEPRFGYIAFNSTLKLLPEYLEAELHIQKLESDYREEIERSKREFDRLYTDFLMEQDNLPVSIVAKRQKELQILFDNYTSFKYRASEELNREREKLLDNLRKRLLAAIQEVSAELDLDWVIDTEKQTYLFISTKRGTDISFEVYKKVGITAPIEPLNDSQQSESPLIPIGTIN